MKLSDIINNLYTLSYTLAVVTFGIFSAKVLYNWIPEDVDDVTFFSKDFLRLEKDFNLQVSYFIDWFDSPITDIPKGSWNIDEGLMRKIDPLLSIIVSVSASHCCNLISYYRISSFVLETYLFSLTKTTYPRVRKKFFLTIKMACQGKGNSYMLTQSK